MGMEMNLEDLTAGIVGLQASISPQTGLTGTKMGTECIRVLKLIWIGGISEFRLGRDEGESGNCFDFRLLRPPHLFSVSPTSTYFQLEGNRQEASSAKAPL